MGDFYITGGRGEHCSSATQFPHPPQFANWGTFPQGKACVLKMGIATGGKAALAMTREFGDYFMWEAERLPYEVLTKGIATACRASLAMTQEFGGIATGGRAALAMTRDLTPSPQGEG